MRALLLFSLLLLFAPRSAAAILDFTFSDTGSGTIGGTAFSQAAFTIGGELNTANSQPLIHDVAIAPDDFTLISISGVGLFQIITPIAFVYAPIESVLQLRSTGTPAQLLIQAGDLSISAISSWDFGSPVGPFTVAGFISHWADGPIQTDGGVLVLSDETRPITFQASVVANAPEPSSAFLAGLGILTAVLLRRRNRPMRKRIYCPYRRRYISALRITACT